MGSIFLCRVVSGRGVQMEMLVDVRNKINKSVGQVVENLL